MDERRDAESASEGGSRDAEYPWPWTGYSDKPQEEMPLAGYATLLAAYAGLSAGVLAATARRNLPERIDVSDVILIGIATQKIGRIITKDWVTSPLRAPFTTYAESTGAGEVSERSRGAGVRRAVGDLLTCAWCIAPWVAGGLYSALLVKPRAARLVASLFASVAISDTLQHAYSGIRRLRG